MALTTPQQAEERRAAARLAGGPTTELGKAISRTNAVIHGLSGSGLLLPEHLSGRVAGLVSELERDLQPNTADERLLVKQMAVFTVKAEEARALQMEARQAVSDRAKASWDETRRVEAHEIAEDLADEPEKTVARLLTTLEGAEWLVSRWFGLKRKAELGSLWDEADRQLALDMLGFPRAYREQVLPTAEELGSDEALRDHLFNLADRELGNIRTKINLKLRLLEEQERDRAERGVESIDQKEVRLFRRYERDAERRFEWAWTQFRKLRQAPAEPVAVAKSKPTARIQSVTPVEIAMEEGGAAFETAYADMVGALREDRLEVRTVRLAPEARPVGGNRRQRRKAEASLRKARDASRFR